MLKDVRNSAMFKDVRSSAKGALNKAKGAFGVEPDEEEAESEAPSQASDRLEELSELCPQLTFQQRLIGFAVSFTLGYLIAFMSFRFFIQLIEGKPIPFACNYTFGQILQLMASTFLCGPKRQFKNMFDEKRRATSIVYLCCLASNLVVIFLPLPGPVKLIVLVCLMMTQCCASVWYSLSYIPYGRKTATRFLKRQLGLNESGSDYANIIPASS